MRNTTGPIERYCADQPETTALQRPRLCFTSRRARGDAMICFEIDRIRHSGGRHRQPATLDLERRLATILSADVAGYSRLMAEDEEQTLRVFRGHSEVFNRHCQLNLGRATRVGGRMRDHAAATAYRHWFAASARKSRSVERETRWR
jgi:hypothetical protein